MPHTKSAAKQLRQSSRRRDQNRALRRELRTRTKKVREAVAGGDLAQAEAEFRLVAAKLDRAGARRAIHPNAAARVKSRLSRRLKGLKAKPAAGDAQVMP
jgi:small subunit ribosomal protein S20